MSKVYNRKDFLKHKNFCLYPFTQLYCLSTPDGFRVKPCCETLEKDEIYAKTISSIKNHDFLKDLRKHFIDDKPLPEMCCRCIEDETASDGKSSRRLDRLSSNMDFTFEVNEDGELLSEVQDLDLRPSNTCNLKCIMCNPWDSSKWGEDIDIYGDVFLKLSKQDDLEDLKKEINKAKQYTDWNELLGLVGYLKRIFIAGGEPFYMKNALAFLQTLVDLEVASDIILEITTNAVSINNALISLLEQFKEVNITISIDGVEDVNYIIRYPTEWSTFCLNINLLYNKFPNHIYFNNTVSALNLLDTLNIVDFTNKYIGTGIILGRCVEPELLDVNSLKPEVINKFRGLLKYGSISNKQHNWYTLLIDDYKYNEENNNKMKTFLAKLDKKRNTNSKDILPWCWV